MTDNEYVEILLDHIEGQNFDCKRADIKPSKIVETICAFANTSGGTIIVGLEDPDKAPRNKRLIGINKEKDNVSSLINICEKEFEPPLNTPRFRHIPITNIDGERDELLEINIEKSNDIHSLRNGDTFRRDGSSNHKMGASEIMRLKYEKGTVKYESEIADSVDLTDLNMDAIEEYHTLSNSETTDMWQFLKDNGLATSTDHGWKLYKSAVLLFGINPAIQLKSKCSLKISHYYGTEPNYSGKPNFVTPPFSIEGSLTKQIEGAIKYFRQVANDRPLKLSGAIFKTSYPLPEWAFQEAIANAVIHRNYFTEDDIQVRFFDDRVEIESPGTYPGHITPHNIRRERFARNPIIQRVLSKFGHNLDIGEGVDRMFRIMIENNLYEPVYVPASQEPNKVLVKLYLTEKVNYWDTINIYLDKNFRINNQKVREITGIQDTVKASKILNNFVKKGLLEQVKSTGYNGDTYYQKPGVEYEEQ